MDNEFRISNEAARELERILRKVHHSEKMSPFLNLGRTSVLEDNPFYAALFILAPICASGFYSEDLIKEELDEIINGYQKAFTYPSKYIDDASSFEKKYVFDMERIVDKYYPLTIH